MGSQLRKKQLLILKIQLRPKTQTFQKKKCLIIGIKILKNHKIQDNMLSLAIDLIYFKLNHIPQS